MDEKTVLRARDFWTSIVLIFGCLFFLFQTSKIPFLNTKVAGVDSADWYNSAALVPYGIFLGMLLLSFFLLGISIRDGGAKHALKAVGIGYSGEETMRVFCISLMLFFYIFGLVPRVDFILASALMITGLIWGFHRGWRFAMLTSTSVISCVALYALIMNFPRSEWVKPHDDDWVALIGFVSLSTIMLISERMRGNSSRVVRITPFVAIITPLVLVVAMAFGFRQNVPNRTGLLFSNIEYHYYVTLRPIWQGR